MIDLKKIEEASERISSVIYDTPYAHAPILSEMCECEVYLKKENLQVTGAFKIRGAFNKIASLTDAQRAQGVVAASAGNHAQGVAYSAKHFGIKAVIVMPESTPLTKVNGVKYYGAEVILAGANFDEAYAFATTYGSKNKLVFVHPFSDEDIIIGQGTVALDIMKYDSKLDAILIPVGGGGLIAGMSHAIKAINPNIRVIGVSALGAPAMKNSFDLKRAVDTTSVRTIADGIAVRDTAQMNLDLMLECVDEMVSVSDSEIASAILFLLERQKIVVEGAGAVGVAALMHHKIPSLKGKRVATVLSGGNVDVTLLSVIIEKGLLKSGRKMKITVTLIDKPGSLKYLTEILETLNANIVHIAYDRTSTDLEYGDANVMIHLETKGHDHQSEIRAKLESEGYLSHEQH